MKKQQTDLLMALFVPTLKGYKGTIIHIPISRIQGEHMKGLIDTFFRCAMSGCKLAINLNAKTYDLLIPDGFSCVDIQILITTYGYEIVS